MKLIATAIFSCLILCLFSSFSPVDEWTNLLDKNLSQWQTYLSYRHGVDYKGEIPKEENGNNLQPIGYNKMVPVSNARNIGDVTEKSFSR